jgi:hypothetical protein
MAQLTHLVRKGGDADLGTVTIAGSLTVTGSTAYGATKWNDAVATTWGTGDDVTLQWDATNLLWTAAADQSVIEWGDASATQKSFHQKFYGNAANGADYLYFDCENNLLYTTGVDVLVKDDDFLLFGSGTGGDVRIEWDTAGTPDALLITALADDTVIEVGNGTNDFDLKWSMSSGNYLTFDASASLIYTTDVDVQIKDNDFLVFGSGSGGTGDVTISWDATDLEMAATGASAAWNIGAASHVINTTITGTLTVGVNDTGHDVQLFGATAGAHLLWDESADSLLLVGGAKLNAQGTVTVGVNDTGYDVQLFGATAGCSMLWDESEDQLVVTGPADVPALKLAGAGSISAVGWAATGAAWADSGATPAFVEDQKFMLIDIAGTVYRIPLWANA